MVNLNVRQVWGLIASILLVCGFIAQFSSKSGSGVPLIVVGFAIITISNLFDLMAFLTGINYLSPAPKTEFNSSIEPAASIFNSFGSLLSLIAMLSMSNDKMSMAWLGLFGSSLIYIGGLLNAWKVLKIFRINGRQQQ